MCIRDRLMAVHQAAAQRLRGLEAGDKDGAAWVFDVVLQVVENAPRLGHAAGADDDRRLAQEVQLLRLLWRAGIGLLYTSDAAAERSRVDLGGRRILKKQVTVCASRAHT